MKKIMNKIIQIKYDEKFFSPEVMAITHCWHISFEEEGIVAYERKYGSRKRENVHNVTVPTKEMRDFFSDIYDFVRTADFNAKLVDDCSHTTTIIYHCDHKEIIEGCPIRGEEQMLSKFFCFLEKHGIKDFL